MVRNDRSRSMLWLFKSAEGLRYTRLAIVFFFQAEDGIRDVAVTGVQTCALPISFIGIAYDILHGIGLLPHQIPLHARRKAGAAHSAKFGGFELCEDVVPCAGLDEIGRASCRERV